MIAKNPIAPRIIAVLLISIKKSMDDKHLTILFKFVEHLKVWGDSLPTDSASLARLADELESRRFGENVSIPDHSPSAIVADSEGSATK